MSLPPGAPPHGPGDAPAPAPDPADPSMDDILASIRRILNEDEAKAPAPVDTGDDDMFLLDPSMIVSEPTDHDAPQIAPPVEAGAQPLPLIAQPVPEPVIPQADRTQPGMPEPGIPAPAVPSPGPVSLSQPAGLVAPAAAAAAASSVGALLRTLATERSTAVHRGGPTIEDLVRDEMRPLLKEWLDTHLPSMVERLVRAEIERVVSRTAP